MLLSSVVDSPCIVSDGVFTLNMKFSVGKIFFGILEAITYSKLFHETLSNVYFSLVWRGSGPEVWGNCNAPKAVTVSAIIYCLRAMVGHDIPLNQVSSQQSQCRCMMHPNFICMSNMNGYCALIFCVFNQYSMMILILFHVWVII